MYPCEPVVCVPFECVAKMGLNLACCRLHVLVCNASNYGGLVALIYRGLKDKVSQEAGAFLAPSANRREKAVINQEGKKVIFCLKPGRKKKAFLVVGIV